MEVTLAESAGFCFGVQRALDKAFAVTKENQESVFCLGPLIHNPQVVAKLERLGVQVVENAEEIDAGVVLVRCHGIAPKAMEELVKRGLTVVDTTCPFVSRAMRWAKELHDDGYQVIIVGDEFHPEVKAIMGASEDSAWIVDSPAGIDRLPPAKRIGIIAQTTQSMENYRDCVCKCIGQFEEIKACDTICTATEERQQSAAKLAAEVDVMIVVGGLNSANTIRLAEVCRESGAITHHVETKSALREEWFVGAERVGVTAGASTPSWLIEGVLERMVEFTEAKDVNVTTNEGEVEVKEEEKCCCPVEEPVAEENSAEEATEEVQENSACDCCQGEPVVEEDTAPEEAPAPKEESMSDFDDKFVNAPQPQDIVKGTVVQVKEDEVMMDIGFKYEGVITKKEFGLRGDENMADAVQEGDEIEALVITIDDSEGNVQLSKRSVDARKAWKAVEASYENGEIIEAKITQSVKGGLLADVGVRGFIPASHADRVFVDDLNKYIGQVLPLKVIELDRKKNNVVLSHKAALEEVYEKAKEEAFARLEEGMVVDGIVRRLTKFGAFVDIGDGVEGLLHVSELAHSRVRHPKDVVSEGDEIKVKVLGVDKENDRISLSLKQTIADPWETITDRYHVGDTVKGVVTRVVDFGAFVKIEDGVEGLVHISQLAHHHVEKSEEVVRPRDDVNAKIISLDPDARRIGLSIKELEPEPPKSEPARSSAKSAKQGKQKDLVLGEDNEELTTNLGDKFGELGNMFKDQE